MVQYLINKYHVSLNDIYIFGDGENDIKMLKFAENSYAPRNALNKAKNSAKNTCLSCEDLGVIQIIIKNILKHDWQLFGYFIEYRIFA